MAHHCLCALHMSCRAGGKGGKRRPTQLDALFDDDRAFAGDKPLGEPTPEKESPAKKPAVAKKGAAKGGRSKPAPATEVSSSSSDGTSR